MGVASAIGLASAAFASTDIDNALVTTAQLATAPPHRVRKIVAGQFAGFAFVVALAASGAGILLELPVWVVGFLGLVPIALGLRGLRALYRRRRAGRADRPAGGEPSVRPSARSTAGSAGQAAARPAASPAPIGGGFFTAAFITVGNGGDNLAVYIPLLRQAGVAQGALMVAWMLVLDVGLCALAVVLGRHPRTLRVFERAGSWLTPAVYCVIGVAVLVRAGTIAHLT